MNYPNGIKKTKTNITSYRNRGLNFEKAINETNEYYLVNNLAIIHKKPIPITICKVDYPNRSKAKIIEAYYSVPSTTDYNGLYLGKYIDFEAKVTKNKTGFPLSNIHTHQLNHLFNIMAHNGISFILVYFENLNKVFLLESKYLFDFLKNEKKKSIPLDYFIANGHLINEGYQPRIDYLKVIDKLYKEVKHD